MKKEFKHTNHSYLRYANCWEDADVLLSALNIQNSDCVISIASAGDNTFSMLSKSPQKVVAVDVNEVQLFLVELKKVCFQYLNYADFIAFLGFKPSQNRLAIFESIKSNLSTKALKYWDANTQLIKEGVIHQGKFENYFKLFRSKIIPLVHTKKRVTELLVNKSNQAQLEFYNNKWNTWRWRLLFKLFFSKVVMAKFGRDKSLFNEVEVNVKEFIFTQAEKEVSTTKCQSNYFLEYILTREFKQQLPHYARPENFESIKANCHKLELKLGLIEDVLIENEKFDKYNLSNIFEYINTNEFKIIANKLKESANSNALFLNWSLMVPRQLSTVNDSFKTIDTNKLKALDKVFFYNDLNLHTI